MGIVPENTSPRIFFYKLRLARWAERASQIGLQEEQVAELEAKVAVAIKKLKQQYRAQEAAKSATLSLHNAMRALSQLGAGMIGQIRATALIDGSSVYTDAWLPPPADPSPIAAPGTPTQFKRTLRSLGELEIRWKCKNPRGSEGTMYEIARKIGDGKFEFLATVGVKRFIDVTLPAGTASVTYRVTAIRSTKRGDGTEFRVSLGVPANIPRQMLRSDPKAMAA